MKSHIVASKLKVLANSMKKSASDVDTLSADEVNNLPIGSIVAPVSVSGGVESALVVIHDHRLAPTHLLPARSGDNYGVDGDPTSAFGKLFVMISKGNGKIPTRGTADSKVYEWMKSKRASVKKRAADSAPKWDVIVQRAADALLSFEYADACEHAADHSDGAEPILDSTPWGAGAEITDYAPSTPADLVAYVEKKMVKVWGKDAVLADCAAFMTETGEDDSTYGWYITTENMGHGVGLFDYGYDTKLKPGHVFENTDAFLQIEDGRVMFYPVDSRDVKPIDVTDDVEHVLLEGEDEATEASTKTASGGYTMTIVTDEGTEDVLDLTAVAADQVVDKAVEYGLVSRNDVYGSEHITYSGDFGDVWLADWETAKGTHKEDTYPKTPLDAWVVAQLCTDKGGNTFSPAEVWIALDQRAGITSAKEATKFVKNAQSTGGIDGITLNEGANDPEHFHEYIGGEYGYLLDEGALRDKFSEEEIEAMDDAAKGRALLEYFFNDSTWYTDGFSMIEARPV